MSGRDLYYRLNPTAHPNAWDAHDPDVRARYDAEAASVAPAEPTMRAALETFVEAFESPYIDQFADLNEAYEKACAALGREPVEINP